jgi:hypothetical protein
MKQGEADPNVVQQLMFNRILAFVQSYEHVTVAAFDAQRGTLEGILAGVNFVINVSLGEHPESAIG